MKTLWTNERLRLLFERYNQMYRRGKLSGWRVVLGDLSKENAWGLCNRREKIITIDPHPQSDRKLRATLLHEMAHAASRSGHTARFFAELERLLRRGAPVKVDAAEAGHAKIFRDIVPKRFPLVRAKMQRAENRRQRRILKLTREKKLKTYTMTNDMIVAEFKDAATELTWKQALLCIGLQYGLTDEGGRAVDAWARRLVHRGRKAHLGARREHLQYERFWRGDMSDKAVAAYLGSKAAALLSASGRPPGMIR
jgi:hypothetical protein